MYHFYLPSVVALKAGFPVMKLESVVDDLTMWLNLLRTRCCVDAEVGVLPFQCYHRSFASSDSNRYPVEVDTMLVVFVLPSKWFLGCLHSLGRLFGVYDQQTTIGILERLLLSCRLG